MKKLITFLFCIMLFITPPIKTYASAGTLVVQGGTIATGGLAAGALAGLAGPAVVIVFAGMMAMGIDIELTQQSQQAGMTKTQFVKNKLNDYCNEAGITAGVFYKGILDGAQVVGDGKIKLTDYACKRIKQFCNWLFDNDMVNNPASSSSGNLVNVGNDITMPCLNNGDSLEITIGKNTISAMDAPTPPIGYFAVKNSTTTSNVTLVLFSKTTQVVRFALSGYSGTQSQNVSVSTTNGYYYRGLSLSGNLNPNIPVYIGLTAAQVINTFSGAFDMTATGVNDGFTGTRDDYNANSGALSPSGNGTAVINPDFTGSIPIPADTNVTINVQDYLDALDKLLNGLQDVTIGAIDQATGVPIDMDIPDTLVIDPTLTREEDDPIHPQIETPVIDDDDPVDPEVSPNLSSEPLKFDLRNIFPFCIPFDFVDMIELLNAPAETPIVHIDWDIPYFEQNLTFDIDFTPYNDVAIILRNMELLLFCIGLAMVTRSIFIRG